MSKVGGLSKSKSSSKFTEIETMSQVKDSEGNTIYYAINYQGGGFVLLSADNRTEPVLAFSDVNTFSVEAIAHTGVSVWSEMTAEQIAELRRINPEQTPLQQAMWSPENISRSLDVDTSDRPYPTCDNGHNGYRIFVGALLQTQWGQYDGYNDRVHVWCNGDQDQAPAGCVPVAMGQIMKYYAYPNNYYWNLMPNAKGEDETARLLRDIGVSVNINYDCDGSSAYAATMCVPGFAAFGYRSAVYANYDLNIVSSQLNQGKPVILTGGENTDGVYTKGHAWVCDGYDYSTTCHSYYVSPGPSLEIGHDVASYTWLRMNWGWSSTNDGWYSPTNFNPGGSKYNYRTGMVYNIFPS